MYSGLLPRGYDESDEEKNSAEQGADVTEDALETTTIKAVSPNTKSAFDSEENDTGLDNNKNTQSNSESESKDVSTDDCLPGVSLEMWKKFKELKHKHLEMKKKPQSKVRHRKRKRHKKADEKTVSMEPEKESMLQAEREAHWNELKQYFGINDRFQPPASSRPLPKTGLEKNIDKAIAEGDLETAWELSDNLAARETAVKIAKSADCRDFVKAKQEAEASREAQKRKKQVAWGFEAKKRWETKSNMGYM
nr:PREDICTED: protein FAM204A isoform X1 [Lepisosteus oculatus]XP_015202507.1 PREDICTED: protein FAM204A isoform X1 [Lepisosteus oculatus]